MPDRCRRSGNYLGADVVQCPPRVDDLYHMAVAIHVDEPPELPPGVHAREEHPLVLAIDPEHHVPAPCDVIIHHRVLVCKLLRQGLGPEAASVGEVGAGVLGQVARQQPGVH